MPTSSLLHLPCGREPLPTETVTTPIPAFKAFNWRMQCRDFQYAFGQLHRHEGRLELGSAGFHATSNPLYSYQDYPPGGSIYAHVELSGMVQRSNDISASSMISVVQPLGLMQVAEIAVDHRISRCSPADTERLSAAGVTSVYDTVAISSQARPAAVANGPGLVAVASLDDHVAKADGNCSVSCATQRWSAVQSSGYASACCATGKTSAGGAAGDQSACCTTGKRASSATRGSQSISCATGHIAGSSAEGCGAISAVSGQFAAATVVGGNAASISTFLWSSASAQGANAVAIALDPTSRAKAGDDGVIILAWREPDEGEEADWRPPKKRLVIAYVGENGIKPDTWYRCDERGTIVEVEPDYPFRRS